MRIQFILDPSPRGGGAEEGPELDYEVRRKNAQVQALAKTLEFSEVFIFFLLF